MDLLTSVNVLDTIHYQVFDSTYSYRYNGGTAPSFSKSYDSSYPIHSSLNIIVDTVNNYLLYKTDTFKLEAGPNSSTKTYLKKYDYTTNVITLSADTLLFNDNFTYFTFSMAASAGTQIKGYKIP